MRSVVSWDVLAIIRTMELCNVHSDVSGSSFKKIKKTAKPFILFKKSEESIKNSRLEERKGADQNNTEITHSSQGYSSQNSQSGSHVCKKKKYSHASGQNVLSQSSISSQELSQSQQLPFSQPDPDLPLKERLLWLQERRQVGLWVQCSRPICNKWRYLKNVHDPIEIPREWFCHMNPGTIMSFLYNLIFTRINQ